MMGLLEKIGLSITGFMFMVVGFSMITKIDLIIFILSKISEDIFLTLAGFVFFIVGLLFIILILIPNKIKYEAEQE